MMQVLKVGLLGILLLGISSIALAIEIQGTVVDTTGLDVTVKIVGGSTPVPGDLMEVSFAIPGGDTLSVGTWKVTSVSGRLVSATVLENTGAPSKGQQAVIISENPVSLTSASNNKTSSPQKKNGQHIYSSPAGEDHITSENREVIALLRSPEAASKRNGAKKAHRYFAADATVLAVVADELNRGYAEKPRDRHHVDAMSWLCNALGASKDIKYKDLLTMVYKKSPSKKIRKYARKNIRGLR